jgi:transcriptional regulator GlxA family with amidase domain
LGAQLGARPERQRRSQRQLPSNDLEEILRVAAFIDQHIDTPLHLGQLSKLARMGCTKFKEDFRLAYGMPVSKYITSRRVSHAKNLLAKRNLSIAEVARSVGYRKPGSFSEVFKKACGISPSEYRNFKTDLGQ